MHIRIETLANWGPPKIEDADSDIDLFFPTFGRLLFKLSVTVIIVA